MPLNTKWMPPARLTTVPKLTLRVAMVNKTRPRSRRRLSATRRPVAPHQWARGRRAVGPATSSQTGTVSARQTSQAAAPNASKISVKGGSAHSPGGDRASQVARPAMPSAPTNAPPVGLRLRPVAVWSRRALKGERRAARQAGISADSRVIPKPNAAASSILPTDRLLWP